MAINKAIIEGRITNEPELRKTNTGKSVTTFCVACDRRNKEEGTDFFEVVAWEAKAEYICHYGGKGKLIYVVGRLTNRKYTDKNGQNRTVTEIVCEEVSLPKVGEAKQGEEQLPF